MSATTLRTDWVCIATEGKAVDGRDITRDWLTDMAETYDPDFYTALLWPEHDRWSNFGVVQALNNASRVRLKGRCVFMGSFLGEQPHAGG